jgi:hypothetical protein
MGESALRARAEVIGSGKERKALLTLTRNGAAVPGATATAQVLRADGTLTSITLTDDGQHADGAAGDGVYGSAAGTLSNGTAVIANVKVGGEERVVVAAITGKNEMSRLFMPFVRR